MDTNIYTFYGVTIETVNDEDQEQQLNMRNQNNYLLGQYFEDFNYIFLCCLGSDGMVTCNVTNCYDNTDTTQYHMNSSQLLEVKFARQQINE